MSSSPHPRLHIAGWKRRDAVGEVFILIFPIAEEWWVLQQWCQQLEQATGGCPKLQAWKQAACYGHKSWARLPAWDDREMITGCSPLMKTSSALRYCTQKGLVFQYLYLQHWQNQIQSSSATKPGVIFLHCPGLRQGDQRTPEPGWDGPCLPGSASSDAAFHRTKLHRAIPRAACSVCFEQGTLVTKSQNWDGHRDGFQAHNSPPRLFSSAHHAARLSSENFFPLSVNSPHGLWWHGLHSGALLSSSRAQASGHGPQASLAQCQHEHPHPSCSFLPLAGPSVTPLQLWLLHEPDWELIWFKSEHKGPRLFFFFKKNVDYFSIQLITWLYKHLLWYHRGQCKGRNGGGCLNHCCWNKYLSNCTWGVLKINT